jgi:sugar phosphate isomerase/epimerase
MESNHDRRQFLQIAAAGAAAVTAGLPSLSPATAANGTTKKPKFRLGLASYTLRQFALEPTLEMTRRLDLKYICFKDFHLPLDSSAEHIVETVAKVKAAGLELYAGGVVYMRNEADVNRAFEYARAAGMKIIVGVPNYDLLPLVDAKVKAYDISLAIHNHGPTDNVYPIPATAYEKVKDLDRRIGLCNDVGHTQRAGIDPADSARKYVDRLLDVHIKDVSAATAAGSTVEMGRGVVDIPKLLRTLIDIDYAGIVAFEYEKDADDPMAGLAESVGYVRGVLATL